MSTTIVMQNIINVLSKANSVSLVPFNWVFKTADGCNIVKYSYSFGKGNPATITHTVIKKFLGFTIGTMVIVVTSDEVEPALWYNAMDMLKDTVTRLGH